MASSPGSGASRLDVERLGQLAGVALVGLVLALEVVVVAVVPVIVMAVVLMIEVVLRGEVVVLPRVRLGLGLDRVLGGPGCLFSCGEALDRSLRERKQLSGEAACVLDDPVALGPDPIGLGVELGQAVLGASTVS